MKKLLAIVLSIAILVMAFPIGVFATEPTVATDTWDGTTVEPTTTDAEGNIIINTAEEMAWVALVGGDVTADKTYKVADNQIFDMGGFAGVTLESTADEVVAATKTEQYWTNDTPVFKGIFDGNGVVVYNVCGNPSEAYGGLFPIIRGTDATIKNLSIKASAFYGYHNAAAIVGLADHQKTVNISKCSVENCYIGDNGNANSACQRTAGVFAGRSGNCNINVSNCFGANNIVSAAGIEGGFIASSGDWSTVGLSVTNSILIGTSPYPTEKAFALGKDILNKLTFTNVYTDIECEKDGVSVLANAQMQGATAKANMALAWNTDWLVGAEGEYPTINFGAPIVDPYVWNGTFTEPTETDADGNIIINTASEMAWVALRGDTATEGKNYKVADDVEYFDMNGSVGITADSTVAEVKAATATSNIWKYEADNKTGAFRGNFDGNGVTIFNIRTTSYGYGALFPYILNDSTIENVNVKASFIIGYHFAGGIVATAEIQSKTVNINKCAVENCYIGDNGNTNTACKRAASGILGGTGNSNVNISNCFVNNNEISAAGFEAAFIAQSGDYIAWDGGLTISNSIAVGITPYSNTKLDGSVGKGLTEKLTVTNVYSDVACDVAGFTTLTTDKMQGSAAKTNMALAWNTDWLVGAEGEYPTINFGEPIKDPYLWDGTFTEPTETDADGNIIINTASEMAWVALRGDTATEGKNYKVADGIEYFDMNGSVGITADSNVAEVKAATATSNIWKYEADNKTGAFRGNFDGNGVTIFNIRTTSYGYGALFPFVLNDCTIENVNVKASFIIGYHFAGGIVATAEIQSKTVNINKCAVENCYIGDNGNTNTACKRAASGILGGTGNSNVNISNCFVNNNEISAAGFEAAFIAQSGDYIAWDGGLTISNSIAVGITPYSNTKLDGSVGKGLTEKLTVTNVYSDVACDVAGFTSLTTDKMQGAVATVTMEALDDTIWFFNTTTYPQLYVFHDVIDGKCECGLEVAGNPCANGHTLVAVEGYDATNFTDGLIAHDKCTVCDKLFVDGVEKTISELVIPSLAETWNGTFVEPTTVDENGNIIINTAEELAWVALRGGAATAGKNYIVAKDSVFNLNGMSGITPFSTVADVKAATKNETYKWQLEIDDQNAAPFQGNFDGNGLIVYNLYTGKGCGYGGLFPVIKPVSNGSVTIVGVSVIASHIGSYHNTGAIIGLANAPDTTTKLIIENCTVKNSYIYDNDDQNTNCQRTVGTIVGNLSHNATTINNCLVVDNEVSAQGIIGGLFGNSSAYGSANTVTNVVSIGTSVQSMMVNTEIKDKAISYANVYTDQFDAADGITILSADKMKGAAAAQNMNLNWNVNWAVGGDGEYPSIIIDNAFYDEWDGTFVEPTTTDDEGNIIINSAEEMAWLALRGGAATEGKNYKVADGIKYFNMNGMIGITLNSSVDDVVSAVKSATNLWRFETDDQNAAPFKGNFDGNGVTIYNIYSGTGRGFGGLFPVTKPVDNGSLTIKNVAVAASYIGGYHNAGGLIGLANCNGSGAKLIVENCVVNNSFVSDNNDQNSACQRTVGILVGNTSHNTTTINNCFVSGNVISAQGIMGGLFGNSSAYAGAINVSNVISIGTKVESTSINYAISDKVANTVYTNVYTDQETSLENVTTLTVEQMSGENAIANTSLDWSGWFATSDLPELRAFHNVSSVDNGDGTHSNECADCTVVGIATPHTFANGECSLCGAACAHTPAEAVVENRVEATCKAEGSYDLVVYCSICGNEISREAKTIEKLAHTEGEAVTENLVESTCTTEGSYDLVVYCSVCGEEVSRVPNVIDIDSDAHAFDDEDDKDCNNGCGFTRGPLVGDINEDGVINGKDASLLMQYINGWELDVEIDTELADVYKDGKVNAKDVVILIRYLNDWFVQLG